jgi:hypothetical protein
MSAVPSEAASQTAWVEQRSGYYLRSMREQTYMLKHQMNKGLLMKDHSVVEPPRKIPIGIILHEMPRRKKLGDCLIA